MKKFRVLVFIGMAAAIAGVIGCGGPAHVYLKKEVNPTGRIAVIIAESKYHELNAYYAMKLDMELSKSTTFMVIPQDYVKKNIKDYPERIKGPYTSSMSEIIENYGRTDVATITHIAETLKADYLYVFWIPSGVVIDDSVNQMHTIAQLYEFPSGKEIAHGKYDIMWATGLSIGAPKTPEEACDVFSKAVVDEIGMNTNSLKPKQSDK